MPDNLSPTVSITERDASQVVPSVTSSVGAVVMYATRGPINTRVLLTNPNDLEQKFGRPNDVGFTHWFNAEAFLKQSNQLWAVRVEDSTKAVPGLTVGISSAQSTGANPFVVVDATTKTADLFPLSYSNIKQAEAKIDYSLPAGTATGEIDNTANALMTQESYHFYAVGPGSVYSNVSVVTINAADYAVLADLRDEVNQAATQTEINAIAEKFFNGTVATTAAPGNPYLSNSLIKYDIIIPPATPGADWFIDRAVLSTTTSFEYGPVEADEGVLIVYNELGNPVEQYLFSHIFDKRDNHGNRMFGPSLINGKSELIYFFIGNNEQTAAALPVLTTRRTFLGYTDQDVILGADKLTGEIPGTGLGDLTGEILTQWQDKFSNTEDVEVDILIDLDYTDEIKRYIDQLAREVRGDCIAVLNVPQTVIMNPATGRPVSSPYTAMKSYVADTLNVNSNFSAIYGNYFKIYDRFAEKERWVPVAGFVAAVMAFTDFNDAQWFAPAGLNRGIISNVIDIAVNPNKGQRDILYYNRINPIVKFTGEGIVIWGQKTLQSKSSAFDRINVRRLFLYLEKSIKKMARYYLFEFNDDSTRIRFRGNVNPFLSGVKARRGVFDYLVVCDTTNNTPEVIDANEFRAEILIKPARVAEFIKLTFTAVGTGVDFNEVVLRS